MSRLLKYEHLPITLLLATALVIGILTVADYGESWDEASLFRYGDYLLRSSRYLFHPAGLPPARDVIPQSGPGYAAGVTLLARQLLTLVPAWSVTTARHFIYFATFLGGVLAFYLLCRRWMSSLGAFGAALLLLTQPLFWGHAFMNPKDLVLLSFFTASVYAGLAMVDAFQDGSWPVQWVLFAGTLMGITSALRVPGAAALLLVLAYGAFRLKWRVLAPAAVCIVVAALITYLTSPHLWGNPIAEYLAGLRTMTAFGWNNGVLFKGRVLPATQLPAAFFPTMIGIQLTVPALLLGAAGALLALIDSLRSRKTGPLILILVWFVFPLLLIVGLRTQLYDNGRQAYFLLPPMFIAAGLCLDRLLAATRRPLLNGLVLLAVALPGIIGCAQLHPYEYVYYNAFVGGTRGAYGRFEMDYWGTSAKEMMGYVNSIARGQSIVLVYGPQHIMRHYSRRVVDVFNVTHDEPVVYEYVAVIYRNGWDERTCAENPIIHTIARQGATFAVLRKSLDGSECH